jgi:uncharacterized membrane protein YdjX (TVP38/TMEM64 family)
MSELPPANDEGEVGSGAAAASEDSVWSARIKTLVRFAPLILLIAGGLAISVLGVSKYFSLSSIIEGRAALLDFIAEKPIRTIAIYSGLYALAVIFSVPGGSLLTVAGGILFGGVFGGIITTMAATLGSVCVYYVARTALGDWLWRRAEKMGPRIANLTEGFRTNAFYVIVVLRLVPVMPYWASNAIPAMFGVRVWTFIAATLVGLLPWTVSFAFFGAALDQLIAAQEIANPGCAEAGTCQLDFSAVTSGPVVTGIVIALLALVPVVLHWWSRRRKRGNETAPQSPTKV